MVVHAILRLSYKMWDPIIFSYVKSASNVSMKNMEIDKKIKKVRKKEEC